MAAREDIFEGSSSKMSISKFNRSKTMSISSAGHLFLIFVGPMKIWSNFNSKFIHFSFATNFMLSLISSTVGEIRVPSSVVVKKIFAQKLQLKVFVFACPRTNTSPLPPLKGLLTIDHEVGCGTMRIVEYKCIFEFQLCSRTILSITQKWAFNPNDTKWYMRKKMRFVPVKLT